MKDLCIFGLAFNYSYSKKYFTEIIHIHYYLIIFEYILITLFIDIRSLILKITFQDL